ncbi:Bacteriophage head-tail adaptor [[Clostridium] sordellii]|uniref:Head-tail adaptor protein n=1 Tax=Paraclostridium sordellii TaxID=1505 RepID=A0ABM9RQA2_PARSO|nr:head-tail adaptor protein [Paeniclostridium sordellii]EPZ54716.1 phage head-tail joining family protein [[Clostridium] sordellii ATCC 9714] [Paeniclostridium sordellii ATCC 9714]CEJ74230.1 hypothetical protein ATCC9714_21181 [[Clostridium] sordellii] [Paeniclostridium sordellii]CEN69772.1 Bacteriophage head-tail adaptor [[Clostridium] sordellii] [Paeniclostridium sordellii]CEN73040.1 Bacteriophage head-tail adaptor [[Clostridium] sordellii] [Paeniclostridium sordellii]CEO25608.1 Bacteriopha
MELNERIIIQSIKSKGTLEDNEIIDMVSLWANIEDIEEKESVVSEKLTSNISKKVIIRYTPILDSRKNPKISKEFQIKYMGNEYEIKSAITIINKQYIKLNVHSI